MKNKFFISVSYFILFLFCFKVNAFSVEISQELNSYQDTLNHYFHLLVNEKDDQKKEALNEKILFQFRNVVQLDESFDFKFDSLKHIGINYSPDMEVKITQWNLPYNDGTHKYFGFIQHKRSKRKMDVFELNDQSENMKSPELSILSCSNWFGALYYKIIENKYRGKTYYTLLGSDLNDLFTKKKIIEILSFDKDDTPVFGAPVFKNIKGTLYRVIFEFNVQADMTLTYDLEKEMIIYDHLSPSKPSLQGQFEFYGPDFSYDGLKYEHGIWNSYPDIDVRNYIKK